METIKKSIEVQAPVRTVYNQWTQFESFPRFMEGVESVTQVDDTHLHWRAEIFGKDMEWDAEITEQQPDQCIAWRSVGGKTVNGSVRFQPAEGGTRVEVTMEYDPEGIVENVGDALGVTTMRVQGDLKRFKEFIEKRGVETGAWRGEVSGGQKKGKGAGSSTGSMLDSQQPGKR